MRGFGSRPRRRASVRSTRTPNLCSSALPLDQLRSRACSCTASFHRSWRRMPDAVQAGGQEVVDGEVDAGRVELLEDGADAADRVAVGFFNARQLDERHLEGLERRDGGRPAVSPLRAVLVEVGRVGSACSQSSKPSRHLKKPCCDEEHRARKHPLLVLGLALVQAAKFALRSIEDHVVAVRLVQQDIEVHVEPAPLTRVLEGQVRRGERVDERRQALLAVEDEVLGARRCVLRLDPRRNSGAKGGLFGSHRRSSSDPMK